MVYRPDDISSVLSTHAVEEESNFMKLSLTSTCVLWCIHIKYNFKHCHMIMLLNGYST